MDHLELQDTPAAALAGSAEEVLELTWAMFGELCRALAVKVARAGYDPDIVIGIARAGVIPGAVVASILRSDFFSLKITRRIPGSERRDSPEIFSEAPMQAAGKRVLIVDEICTSGETLRMAVNTMRNVGPTDIRTATSIVKAGGHRPDYSAMTTDAEVIFPWDRQIATPDGDLIANPAYQNLL